jgi:hypothetical protein
MDDWLHNLPLKWMAPVIFTIVYLAAGAIFAIIMLLARGERALVFKRVSPGLLSPLGTVFGLLVVFSIFQVWGDFNRARVAVDREASAIRTVVLLATSFPGEPETQIRNLVRRHIDEAVAAEWPEMAKRSASLKVAPAALAELLRLALSLTPQSQGQIVAQREIVAALENAMDARRERINLSQSTVNWVKWSCMFAQAICALVAIALVHSENRAAAAIAMGVFATGVAVCGLLIASHDRPFTGEISVKPDVLLQVRPE